MVKASNKTKKTEDSVESFIDAVSDETKRNDSLKLLELMQQVTGWNPKMWGSIVGFGDYHYKYESGREGDYFRLGFSPRAKNISIYIMPGYQDFDDELSRLGKHKMGKACLYINKLSDVDESVLLEIFEKGLNIMAEKYPLED